MNPDSPSSDPQTMSTPTFSSDGIFKIHPSHASRRINLLPLSTRARNVLKSAGWETLGDLNGESFSKLLESRNCGQKTYEEILKVGEMFSHAEGLLHSKDQEHSAAAGIKVITVPTEARSWPVDLLPFSVRLRHVIEKLECRTLGDIHGLSYTALTEMPDCGVRTLQELCDFIARIEKGEFGASHRDLGKAPAAFLASTMDRYSEGLREQQKEIFLDRLGANGEPQTLLAVGKKFDMTRERVRQIMNVLAENAKRYGGPPFDLCLQEFSKELNEKVLPLTPALFEVMLKAGDYKPKHLSAFYIRILGWLSADVSMWPVGQTPAAYRQPNHEKVISHLKEWFKRKTEPVKLVEAYQGLKETGFEGTPFQFLEAIRFAAEFAINLDDPNNPVIHPPVEAPRRWARSLLSESDSSNVPADVWARAKALMDSRRSPSSRYRLANAKPC
jgi:hypothetical protein